MKRKPLPGTPTRRLAPAALPFRATNNRSRGATTSAANYAVSCSSQRRLCFSGFLRLSSTTRVPAGDSPATRALRRASFPFSSFFFFFTLHRLVPTRILHHPRNFPAEEGAAFPR